MRIRITRQRDPNFYVEDHGVAVLFHTLDDDGDEWLQSRYAGHQHLFGGTLVVARSEAGLIVAAIRKAGLLITYREDDFE